jgi:L-rhamnose mutarotase
MELRSYDAARAPVNSKFKHLLDAVPFFYSPLRWILERYRCREIHSQPQSAWREAEMKRFGMVIRLKPGCAKEYRKYHTAVWPQVIAKMRECNIVNYSIYFKDDMLFSYFEYHGEDMKTDWAKMAADTKTQEWWAVVGPLQEPLATRKEGEWWAEMEELVHLD